MLHDRLVHVKSPLDDARATIDGFCEEINSSKFFQSFPSVQKRTKEGWHGFYPHASKDPAELRYEFLNSWRRRSTSPHE